MKHLKKIYLVLLLNFFVFAGFAQNWTYKEYAYKEVKGKVIFLLEFGESDKVWPNGQKGEGVKWRFTNNSNIMVQGVRLMRRKYIFINGDTSQYGGDQIEVDYVKIKPGSSVILFHNKADKMFSSSESEIKSIIIKEPIVLMTADLNGDGKINPGNQESRLETGNSMHWNFVSEYLNNN